MSKTRIEWADRVWNPITGCTHAFTPGCDNCYARRMAKRLAGRFGYPEKPHEFDVTFHADKLEEPLRWRKPRVVFVCSMGDLFHEDVTWEQRGDVWQAMYEAPQHTFLVLTKRPAEMRDWFVGYWQEAVATSDELVLSNVYLGVSVETQDQMWRVEELVKIPGKHWVNFGPLLGPVTIPPELLARLAGVAVEGESGPGARPMHPDWARSIRTQCLEAGIPFTFKQWGEWKETLAVWPDPETRLAHFVDIRGNLEAKDYSAMLHDPSPMIRVGKKAAGRLLDGQLWNQWPWHVIGGMPDGE